MARASLHMYALRRAVDVLGGVAELATRLGLSQTRLNLYLADLAPIPEAVFLRIVDVLTDHEVARLSDEGEGPRSRGDGAAATPNDGKRNGSGKRGKV